ncbi:MAG: hypothetical protein V1820_00870 [archaeon]
MTALFSVAAPGTVEFMTDGVKSKRITGKETCCNVTRGGEHTRKLAANIGGTLLVGVSGWVEEGLALVGEIMTAERIEDAVNAYFRGKREYEAGKKEGDSYHVRVVLGAHDGKLVYLNYADPKLAEYCAEWIDALCSRGNNDALLGRIERETTLLQTDLEGREYRAVVGGCAGGHLDALKEFPFPPGGRISIADPKSVRKYLYDSLRELSERSGCNAIGPPHYAGKTAPGERDPVKYVGWGLD